MIIIILVTVTEKLFSIYKVLVLVRTLNKERAKIVVLVRILMSKSEFEEEVLIKLIVGVVKHEACHHR
jgi:hypothetical protein